MDMGGPFFMGLALAHTVPTGIGRHPSTICEWTSMRHSSSSSPLVPARKRLPAANGSSLSTPLVLASRRPPARRPLAQPNVFFTSAPPSNVRGRLHVANASLTRRLLVSVAAQAWQTAAAQVIFLWLRRRRLFARLACQTSR
jgi:hypothetical protein